jgi:hypothetical protein
VRSCLPKDAWRALHQLNLSRPLWMNIGTSKGDNASGEDRLHGALRELTKYKELHKSK